MIDLNTTNPAFFMLGHCQSPLPELSAPATIREGRSPVGTTDLSPARSEVLGSNAKRAHGVVYGSNKWMRSRGTQATMLAVSPFIRSS